MKYFLRIILFGGLLFSANLALCQTQTLFLDKEYNAALKQSKIQKKPLVIMFYATWCAHCNKMKNEVFTDSLVTQFYRSSFVCMAVDAESPKGIALKNKFKDSFKVSNYPTFAFLDSNETLLYCMFGEFKKENFIGEGKNILIPQNQLPALKEQFLADVSNADNCIKYIANFRKTNLDATQITQRYLKTLKEPDLFTELNWRIMSNGINDFDSDEFKFIVKNKEEFGKVASPKRVERKIAYVVSETFNSYMGDLDTINYNKRHPIAAAFQIRKVDSLLFRFDLYMAENTKNWNSYQKAAKNNIQKFAWTNSNLIDEIGTNYLASINDKNGLLDAFAWEQQSLLLGESVDKYILITKLLAKTKDYKKAQEFAQKGKAIALKYNWNTTEIDKLLLEINKK
ncbi:MAG: thioredoxin family protein [Flavobacterium sp.]